MTRDDTPTHDDEVSPDDPTPLVEEIPNPSADRVLAAGQRLGRYEVGEVLGVGGMGEVYRARDPHLERDVAIKVLRGRLAPGVRARARLEREAQAMARLAHPNVVAIHDVGTFGPYLYLAMELVGGRTLRAKHDGQLAWRDVVADYIQAGRGLAAAHGVGLVHRDFKPDNVLIGSDGRVRVSDFGLAAVDADEAGGIPRAGLETSASTLLGTPAYMAPEATTSARVDARADQYSFFVSLHQGLYGTLPARTRPLRVPRVPAIPRALAAAIARGLATDRDARFGSMTEAVAALERAHAAPRRARVARTVAITAVAAGLFGAAATMLTRTRDAVPIGVAYAASATRLAEVWDRPRHDAMLAHFGEAPRSDVASTRDLVVRDLDTYARTWGEQWDAANTSDEAVTDPLLHAQRINCLERALVDLQGVATAIAAVDPVVFAFGWKGNLFTDDASPLADCLHVARVRAMPPAPTEAHRAEVARLVVAMHVARFAARAALNNAEKRGSFEQALGDLADVETRLDALGSSITAEAAYWRGSYSSRRTERTAVIEHATQVARRTRNDRWLARGLVLQANAALDDHDITTARALLPAIDEAALRAGDTLARFDVRARLALEEGRYAESLLVWRASRIAGDAIDHFGLDHRSAEIVHLLIADGRRAEAVTEARAHAARLDAVWRGDHWMVADAHERLALALAYARDFEAAGQEIASVLSMQARMASPPARAYSARLLAIACTQGISRARADEIAALLAPNEPELELDLIGLAVQWAPLLLEWALARAHPSVDENGTIASVALELGDLETARTYVARVPDTGEHVDARFVRGMLALQAKATIAPLIARLDRETPAELAIDKTIVAAALELARGDARRARDRLASSAPSSGSTWESLRGRALEATGEWDAAIPVLEHALYLAIDVEYAHANHNELVGDTAFALARALAATRGDRARVVRLVELARDFYPVARRREREGLASWLTSISSAR